MSAATARARPGAAAVVAGRVDVDHLRELVTVPAVLRAAGIEVDRERGRIACPLHGGSNRSAFSYARDVYFCHAGCGGGDVFTLVERLYRCDFRRALAHLAALAGLPADRLPQLSRAEIERRHTIARRRAALRRWRDQRLTEWLNVIGALDREQRLLMPRYMQRGRDEADAGGDGWKLLASLHHDLERAELLVAALLPDDEESWAQTALAEQRHDVPTPEEVAL